MQLYPQQQKALELIKAFVQDKKRSVFILKGYAGTGKTTMLRTLVCELQTMGKHVVLMAPTGRAAKVLQKKTGYLATTIHRGIYEFSGLLGVRHDESGKRIGPKNKDDRSKGSDDLQLWFDIRQQEENDDPSKKVFIIDESSMINSRKVNDETLHFGTDILINDLMTYVQPHLGGKVIFVGDPAQLPPVGDNRSVALDESYFEDLGVSSFELTDIIRQAENSAILKNAWKIRALLKDERRNELCFERKEREVIDITQEDVVRSFTERFDHPSIGDGIIICYTNALVYDYNKAIRKQYFPNNPDVCPNDILMVVRNWYGKDYTVLFNGDFVRVLDVSPEVEWITTPVWTDISGKRARVSIKIGFRDATIQTEEGIQIRCKIFDSLLNSREPSLTPLEGVALYINFRIRHQHLKENEEAFKDALTTDSYFNAIQVKYAYAITGHKAQGGEWKCAYVDYTRRTGLNDESLRWSYTATTRASQVLYGVNMPDITPISKLVISQTIKAGKPSREAFRYAEVGEIEGMPASAQSFQKQKYINVKHELDLVGFYLSEVKSFQYDDKYYVETPSGTTVVDCYYNAAGMFTRYSVSPVLPENEQILSIFNNEKGMQFDVKYEPTSKAFSELYSMMQSLCDSLDIQITNIKEHLSQYNICFYLKTSGKFSTLQFYFDKNNFFTHLIPSSDMGMEDELLNQLLVLLG